MVTPSTSLSEDAGEISPIVSEAGADFPGIPLQFLQQMYTNKWKAKNLVALLKLGRSDDVTVGTRIWELDQGGKFASHEKTHAFKEYGSTPTIWARAFMRHVWAMHRLFGKTPRISLRHDSLL